MRKQPQQKTGKVARSSVATSPKNKKVSDPEQSQQIEDEAEAVASAEEKEADNQIIAPDGESELKKEPEPLF